MVYFGFMLLAGTAIFVFIQSKVAAGVAEHLSRILIPSQQNSVDPARPELVGGPLGLDTDRFDDWSASGCCSQRAVVALCVARVVDKYFGPMRDWRSAEVLQRLGAVTAGGRPLPSALSTLARYHFDPAIRHKLLFARNEVEQGADLWQSLATVRLVNPAEATVMEVATRSWQSLVGPQAVGSNQEGACQPQVGTVLESADAVVSDRYRAVGVVAGDDSVLLADQSYRFLEY